MSGLRALLLTIAILLALDPVIRKSQQLIEPSSLIILIDNSASIGQSDNIAGQTIETRLAKTKRFLHSATVQELGNNYQLEAWSFAKSLTPSNLSGEQLNAKGNATAIGQSLMELSDEFRGRALPNVVVISDGQQNHGLELKVAAQHLASEGIKVHCLGLGNPKPSPDLALERVQASELVLAGDEALFVMRLRGSGSGLPATATVELLNEANLRLDSRQISPSEQIGTRFSLGTILQQPGLHHLHAVVDPIAGETALDNNRLDFTVEVQPLKIRVLYVEGRPRFEYRYLKNRLIRANQDINARCWLAEAGRDFVQEASPGLPALRRVPLSAEELLNDFDVVIIGDVDPQRISPDPLDAGRFINAVAEFVSKGGGLLMLAGERHNPNSFRGTLLEDLLPVFLSREAARSEEFKPLPSDPKLPHPVTRVASSPADTMKFWNDVSPLWWWQPVDGLKPGAQAWLINPDETDDNGQAGIVAASIFAPEGRVGWLGTDESWRWRDPSIEHYLSRFWRSILRHLANGRLQGDRGRARLDVDRSRIELGESVLIEARVRDEDWEPLADISAINIHHESRQLPAVKLMAISGEAGLYRGHFRPNDIGEFSFVLTADNSADGEVLDSVGLTVALAAAEMRDTSQNIAALKMLSSNTGGMFLQIDQAADLLSKLDGREKLTRTVSSSDTALADWRVLVLFMLLIIGEWLMRKRSNLS